MCFRKLFRGSQLKITSFTIHSLFGLKFVPTVTPRSCFFLTPTQNKLLWVNFLYGPTHDFSRVSISFEIVSDVANNQLRYGLLRFPNGRIQKKVDDYLSVRAKTENFWSLHFSYDYLWNFWMLYSKLYVIGKLYSSPKSWWKNGEIWLCRKICRAKTLSRKTTFWAHTCRTEPTYPKTRIS